MAGKTLMTGTALHKHKETAFPDSSHCSFDLTLLRIIISGLNSNKRGSCWEEKLVSLLKSALVWIKKEDIDASCCKLDVIPAMFEMWESDIKYCYRENKAIEWINILNS